MRCGRTYPPRTVRTGSRRIALLVALVGAAALAQPAAAKPVPASAAEVARSWVRDWSRGEETAVCTEVARPLLKHMALASGTSACSGAVASALRAGAARWRGVSIVTQRTELVSDTLARATFTLRHALAGTAPVRPDRIWLTRPDARTGAPWRVASLGLLPFIASGTSEITYDPATLDPPGARSRQDDPVRPGRLSPACGGQGVTVTDAGGDVRSESPPSRMAGQLLPTHPRGDRFGTIVAQRPFAFTGGRRDLPSVDLRALTMSREADGHVCLQVRFAKAPRPDSRLLVRWFEPVPGSATEGAAGAVEVRFDGRGGMHFWFDRSRTAIADPDLVPRLKSRVPDVGRSGNVLSIRLSTQDLSNPERFRIALQSASTSRSDPGDVRHLSAGDTMGGDSSGFEWPNGHPGTLFDAGTGPVN
jgi:hypothetical protein